MPFGISVCQRSSRPEYRYSAGLLGFWGLQLRRARASLWISSLVLAISPSFSSRALSKSSSKNVGSLGEEGLGAVPLGTEEHTLKPDYTFLLAADFHPQPLNFLLKLFVCRLPFHTAKVLNFNELAKFSRRCFSCFQHNFHLCFRLLGNAFCAGRSAIFLL